jgi:hypothetical protein
MNKAINIENSSNNVVRVLSIAEPDIIENNPTNQTYILVDNFVEPPELQSHMSVHYCMYNKTTQELYWIQVQYQNTATEELLEIENLKVENNTLKNQLQTANENIDMLTETIADMIGGAI